MLQILNVFIIKEQLGNGFKCKALLNDLWRDHEIRSRNTKVRYHEWIFWLGYSVYWRDFLFAKLFLQSLTERLDDQLLNKGHFLVFTLAFAWHHSRAEIQGFF